jgi:membrane protein GlpM
MDLLIKALLGGAIVVLIQALARTKNAYVAGLVPLFPTFALIAHYIVGTQRSTAALKETIRFGMWSLVPYFVYLMVLYLLVDRFRLPVALAIAVTCWLFAAVLLIVLWKNQP